MFLDNLPDSFHMHICGLDEERMNTAAEVAKSEMGLQHQLDEQEGRFCVSVF
jgi:hypothetical protein